MQEKRRIRSKTQVVKDIFGKKSRGHAEMCCPIKYISHERKPVKRKRKWGCRTRRGAVQEGGCPKRSSGKLVGGGLLTRRERKKKKKKGERGKERKKSAELKQKGQGNFRKKKDWRQT